MTPSHKPYLVIYSECCSTLVTSSVPCYASHISSLCMPLGMSCPPFFIFGLFFITRCTYFHSFVCSVPLLVLLYYINFSDNTVKVWPSNVTVFFLLCVWFCNNSLIGILASFYLTLFPHHTQTVPHAHCSWRFSLAFIFICGSMRSLIIKTTAQYYYPNRYIINASRKFICGLSYLINATPLGL